MTIKDLAAKSGYAVGTVSRVLNDQPNVSEKARKKIIAIALDEGFELNTNAKNLKQKRSNSILAVVRGVHNVLFGALVEQLQALSADSPYRLTVDYIDELADEVARGRRLAKEIKPRGILFLGGNYSHFCTGFEGIGVPSVLVTNSARHLTFPNLSSVTTDDQSAAAAVIRHLAGCGHREIAIIGGDLENSDTSCLRFAGCMDEFSRQGICFDFSRRYKKARYSYADGYAAMTEILSDSPEVTAVFAVSDVMAIGAARAVYDMGKSIPEDVSIVGFDGLPICDYYAPRLTTVIQQTAFMAETSFEILDKMIQSGAGARHVLAPYELSSRGSVKTIA